MLEGEMPSFVIHVETCRRLCDRLKLFRRRRARSLAVVGSAIPDLEWVGVLSSVHGRCREFLQYISKKDPKYVPLAFGMLTHDLLDSVASPDDASEKSAKRLLKKYHNFALNYDGAAHILVEHIADVHAAHENPKILEVIDNARGSLRTRHYKKMAFHLTNFFGGEYQGVLEALQQYRSINVKSLNTVDGAVDLWARHIFAMTHKDSLALLQKAGWHYGLLLRIKIALQYAKFRFSHKRAHLRELVRKGRKEFRQHMKRCNRASFKIHKQLAVIMAGIVMK